MGLRLTTCVKDSQARIKRTTPQGTTGRGSPQEKILKRSLATIKAWQRQSLRLLTTQARGKALQRIHQTESRAFKNVMRATDNNLEAVRRIKAASRRKKKLCKPT